MKANELRIGSINEYNSKGKEGWLKNIVDWQDLKWIEENEDHYNKHHRPIQLDEQWLKKFGFEKKSDRMNGVYIKIHNDFNVYEFHILGGSMGILHEEELNVPAPTNENLNNKIDLEGGMWNFAWDIKYVHQLQNLYHALTGEELKALKLESVSG